MSLPAAIVHRQRVASTAECARLFRALAVREVHVNGWRATVPAAIEALATAPWRERGSSVNVERGQGGDDAWAALAELVTSHSKALRVETASAMLRAWAASSEVTTHAAPSLVAAAIGAPVAAGTTQVDGMQITCDERRVKLDVTAAATACRLFRAIATIADPTLRVASISDASREARPALARFLIALHAPVEAWLELEVEDAEALADTIGGDTLDWQGGGVHVQFPEGTIRVRPRGTEPTEADKALAVAELDRAIERAGLRRRRRWFW